MRHDENMPDECPFCAIAAGRQPAAAVLNHPDSVAFLDRRPLFPGHCLLIPRAHYETLADLPEEQVGPLFAAPRRLCSAVEKALGADGSFLAVNNRVSQSVPHLHIHVVPRRRKDGLKGFFWPRGKYNDEAHIEEVRAAIERELAQLG